MLSAGMNETSSMAFAVGSDRVLRGLVALADLSLRDLAVLDRAVFPDADAGHVVEVDLMEANAVVLGGAHDVDRNRDQPERDGS
jgi:hypothetical protein